MEVTAILNAYLWQKYSSVDPAALLGASELEQDERNRILSALTFTAHNVSEGGDYIPVGIARITLELIGRDQMVTGQVEALKAKRKKVMAESQLQIANIDDQIAKLQALTFEG